MAQPPINTGFPVRQAMRRGGRVLAQLEADGADFVGVDETHAYLRHRDQLVNLYDHQQVIPFLQQHGYLKPRTDNLMIVAAWIIYEGIHRCA